MNPSAEMPGGFLFQAARSFVPAANHHPCRQPGGAWRSRASFLGDRSTCLYRTAEPCLILFESGSVLRRPIQEFAS
jgi:hypothetical protein